MRVNRARRGLGMAGAVAAVAAGAGATTAQGALSLQPVPAAEILTPREDAGVVRAAARPGLVRFTSCSALGAHMRDRARQMVGPYGLRGRGGMSVTDIPLRAAPAVTAEADASAAAPDAAAPAMSGTNVQEAGIDEPDIAKTDGRRLYSLSGMVLRVVDITGDSPVVLGAIDLSALGAERLFLVDGRPIVIGQTWDMDGPDAAAEAATSIVPQMPGRGSGVAADIEMAPGASRTTVAEIDAADPAHMRVRTTVHADGRHVAARYADGTVRLVVASSPDIPGMVTPAGAGVVEHWAAGMANRRAVDRSAHTDWLPRISVHHADRPGVTERQAVPCDDVSRPRRDSGLGMATVLTLDVRDGLTLVDSDAIVTDADLVYASAGSLYVATPDRTVAADDTRSAPDAVTLVHRLDTGTPGRTEYRASGAVRGIPLNQFSMSEHEGHLRIATTVDGPWSGTAPASESFVTVLAERDGRLVRRGRVGGLGRGERIYSVRFMGSRGYVVTFRQTDPLYSLDLSDPSRPRVTGELKIMGYSAYLHPVDETTLIGVGQDATAEGRTLGPQVSLFDVSDPARPRRMAQRRLGQGWSEAEHDHHAVMYWPATGLLSLPLESWGPRGARFAGAVGMRVTRAGGIAPVGRISHGPDAGPVRRSMVVGDALYTVSDSGVKRSTLDGLDDRGWAAFD